MRRWPLLAAAAVVLVALGVTRSSRPAAVDSWSVEWLDGTSWSDARVVREAQVRPGESLETAGGRVRIAVGDIGEVQLEPATRVALVDAGRRDHRLSLTRGTMHATIWAPPGHFYVETPSATAVDLGCRYSLEVTDEGSGVLRVEAGWVGIEHEGRLALIPAGAVGETRTGHGPGTPHYEDAPVALGRALDVFDFDGNEGRRADALTTILAEARERDALTLWHLLARTRGADRARVFERLAGFVPPPASITREGILRSDQAMLEAWWGELGLGTSDFWRMWTTRWSRAD
jgi:hypothetical protein